MSDPLRGQYCQKRYFKHEFELAKERLRSLGGIVSPGIHDYEAFTWEAPGVKLIFYPHKTSAQNYHIRVRPGKVTNKAMLTAAIFALAENSCTFQFPSDTKLHDQAVAAALKRQRATPTDQGGGNE